MSYLLAIQRVKVVERRGGVVSESDARPKGREFESRPIRDVRLCSWAKHNHKLPVSSRIGH